MSITLIDVSKIILSIQVCRSGNGVAISVEMKDGNACVNRDFER